ncbi:hypothetical protein KSP40_PGU010597 [Platanthera guangdongensis]|uniref:Uncharacterized protein n=1 Tax=Platanthera guangdongensis TaxID=2320717 RepID=A0ABR2M7C5_9ASPA
MALKREGRGVTWRVGLGGPPRFEGDRPRFGDRDGYRGGPRGGDFGGDKSGAPPEFQPSFRKLEGHVNGAGSRPAFGRGGGGFGAPPSSSLEWITNIAQQQRSVVGSNAEYVNSEFLPARLRGTGHGSRVSG